MFFKVRSALAASLFCFGVVAHAQTWPDQTVKIVVAYPAGSTMDTVARLIAPSLQSQLGHPFIVENRPGAGGRIGAEYVSHSKADGYTLFISGNSTHSANPSLYKNLPYDPIKDFTQIMRLTTIPYALVVSPKIQARTLADFAASGRANGGKFNYA
jgi:tripartite-type tricarboxylate transporter receptor subunit TctC